jgi:hypothetical protein
MEYLKVYNFNDKIRLGSNGDGGYVIGKIKGIYDCYISAGVSDEESFSRDFINMYKMNKFNSYAFDGTINNYPYKYTKNITFVKKNINTFIDEKNVNLSNLINYYNDIFLKMDIEGYEVPWLLSLSSDNLNKFKQITMEIHGLNDDSFGFTKENKIECLKKLSDSHYLIHAHANNYNSVKNNIPDVLELTYIRKNYFKKEPLLNKNKLPIIGLDYKNSLLFPEIDLNYIPFVN